MLAKSVFAGDNRLINLSLGREIMKEHIKVFTGSNEVQWLYSQDWEYHDYGNCKRCLQIIFPL